jgi:hypothetical protein
VKAWFTTHTLVRGKKKRDYWLTWVCDTPVEGGLMVIASDMQLYMDSFELGARVTRMIDR